MTYHISRIFFFIVFLWTGHSGEWIVDFATALVQLAIWCTLLSLIPFLNLWIGLKERFFKEVQKTKVYNQNSCFFKFSFLFTLSILRVKEKVKNLFFELLSFSLFLTRKIFSIFFHISFRLFKDESPTPTSYF